MTIDVYAFWRNALKTEAERKKITPLATMYQGAYEDPQPGLYRVRKGLARNGGVLVPVKIWVEDDEGNVIHKMEPGQSFVRNGYEGGTLALTGEINGGRVGAERLSDVWICCEAVSKAMMDHYTANEHWPDEAPRLSNQAPTDPLECLEAYMETAASFAAKTVIDTKDKADQAANYVAELLKLKKAADDDRDTKVRPHLEAQRDINGKYKPVLDDADKLVREIRAKSDAFLRAETARREAEAAKARAAFEEEKRKRDAEAARILAERAKLERDDPIAAYTSPPPELPPEVAPPPEPEKVLIGGARGKRMGLRTVTEYRVTDYAALLAFVARHPKVIEAVESAGKAMAKAGTAVPGIEAVEVERVQ